jgi:hypothetical protein
MYDYSYVLRLLRASAVEHRRHARPGNRAEIANRTTERVMRNRALLISHRLQGMDELRRHQYVAEAVRRL